MNPFRVVVCGGGIAAVEGVLRLRKLAGDSIDICLVAPNDELVLRPLAVRQPFAGGPPKRYPLKRIVADADAEWIQDSLASVDTDAHLAHTEQGEPVHFDALLLAVGARQVSAFEHAATFRDADADAVFEGVVQDIEEGYSKRLAFLQPEGPVYPLPLYELALMTAERARSMSIDDLDLTIVTPEHRPLIVFGPKVSDAVSDLLAQAGVTVHANSTAHVPTKGALTIEPAGTELQAQRMVALPRLSGPSVRGIAGAGAHGFIPIGRYCAVPGTHGRVFAAGDAAEFPIKHGGLGSEMADSAASAIAILAGLDMEPEPFHPVIRAKLLGGHRPLYISARLVGSSGFESEVHDSPPWPEDEKVVAQELGPYLAGLDEASAKTRSRA